MPHTSEAIINELTELASCNIKDEDEDTQVSTMESVATKLRLVSDLTAPLSIRMKRVVRDCDVSEAAAATMTDAIKEVLASPPLPSAHRGWSGAHKGEQVLMHPYGLMTQELMDALMDPTPTAKKRS